MEDYEKKYKEALERAKKVLNDEATDRVPGTCMPEYIFPELRESGDERIRKALITFFQRFPYDSIEKVGTNAIEALAWLEKQGDTTSDIRYDGVNAGASLSVINGKPFDYEKATITQKDFAPKEEPKFKVGDWITNSIETVQITGYDIDYGYQVDYKGNLQHRDTDIIEKEYHLWTIQDAKDGDVLCVKYGNDEMPFIFTGKQDDVAYCALNSFGEFVLSIAEWLLKTSVFPAAKEQRDLLFQKMKEAGYEWDADKKDLKKVEDKTTWSEEDDYNLQCMIAKVTSDIQKGNVGRNNELIDWLKSLKDRVQPKQEWSEEDESYINNAIAACRSLYGEYSETAHWLKSLKDRLPMVKNC